MPLVPSVVLPVADAMSWDVPAGQHKVLVFLQKEDPQEKKMFNAAAIVAFARTHRWDDMRVLQGCNIDPSILRPGNWLRDLREEVGRRPGWALEHVRFVQ